MNRQAFFDAARRNPFGGSLSADQVSGLEAILDGWQRRGLTDLRWLAYMLATAFHETARTMLPIKEYGGRDYFMRMYDKTGARPRVAERLGNTVAGDGATFCGRGYVQITGRANYAKAARKLGADFVGSPDLVLQPEHAAEIMFLGMTEGWFTGRKLADYFTSSAADWSNARRIINGVDMADTIAGYGKAFYAALLVAQDGPIEVVAPAPPTKPAALPVPDPEQPVEPTPPVAEAPPQPKAKKPPTRQPASPSDQTRKGFWLFVIGAAIAVTLITVAFII